MMVVLDAMAAKLVQQPFPSLHVAIPTPRRITETVMSIHRTTVRSANQRKEEDKKKNTRSGQTPTYAMRVAAGSSEVLGGDRRIGGEKPAESGPPISQIKSELYRAVEGINRGIFGVPSEKKSEIEALVKLLESQNPTPDPALNLDKAHGCWRLIYSTITILGPKRTKLGLRDLITLGDFFQTIHVPEGKAVNAIEFSVSGFKLLSGQLTIEASFKIASKSRVDINYKSSTITPDQLMNMFRKNYNLLLSIFNPEGWLDISYIDDTLRIGRDDKGNIFLLERCEGNMR